MLKLITGNFVTFIIRKQMHAFNHMNFWRNQTGKMWEQLWQKFHFTKVLTSFQTLAKRIPRKLGIPRNS